MHSKGCTNCARHREGASEALPEKGAYHVHQLRIVVFAVRLSDMGQKTLLHGCTGSVANAERRADPQPLRRAGTGLAAYHCHRGDLLHLRVASPVYAGEVQDREGTVDARSQS